MSSDLSDIGLYGLAVMGQNFALNMAEHGFKVSVCNRSPAKVFLFSLFLLLLLALTLPLMAIFLLCGCIARWTRPWKGLNRKATCPLSASKRFVLFLQPCESFSLSFLHQPEAFIASLAKPRKVVILVMAGKPVDDTIELLRLFSCHSVSFIFFFA